MLLLHLLVPVALLCARPAPLLSRPVPLLRCAPRCLELDSTVDSTKASLVDAIEGVVVPTGSVTSELPAAAPDEASAGRIVTPDSSEYQRGVLTVAFITLLFASNSPALHAAFTAMEHSPPPLLINAAAGAAALVGLLWGGPLLGRSTELPSTLEQTATDTVDAVSVRAGGELGLLKFFGTTANLYGLSLTSAAHGASAGAAVGPAFAGAAP